MVDPKQNEYGILRSGPHSSQIESPRDTAGDDVPLEQNEIRPFVEGITPGTEHQPRLVVIDNGDHFFADEPEWDGGNEWLDALKVLLSHPYTAVAIQSLAFWDRVIPTEITNSLESRLLLGKAPSSLRRKAFAGFVPTETLGAFDFNVPTESDPMGQGEAVLWDGEHLQHADNKGRGRNGPSGVYVGESISGTGSGPMFVDVIDPDGDGTGSADQYRWAGRCGTEEQAVTAWESLGSPGDRDLFVKALMRLEPDQFIFSDPSWGRTQIIKVDAEALAQMMGRKSLGE